MLKLSLILVIFIGFAMLLLCIRILFEKNGKFGSEHIGHSKAMRKRGIHCVQSMDRIERAKYKNIKI